MMQQQHGNPAGRTYRPGSIELIIALGTLTLVLGIGIGVILNQAVPSAAVAEPVATARPTRVPKAKPTAQAAQAPKAKPTAQAAQVPKAKPTAQAAQVPKAKPTAQAAKPTSAANAAAPALTSAPATAAPAPTSAPPAAAPAAEPAYIEYTVQKGDILYTLATKHGVTVEEILAINTIKNPASLTVGQVIRIPKK